ncbi:predicted protein [Sclerotinia sclerotiorum 1980 UF-70]|uniref:Uncharacterized protein n=1 Tax=Sclerotinia sclerotiorum (strain ATCC 18683 / 1980 / Ss-1) TaxID=665079 RepID=A7F0Y5_SCLS1|nr:predicted protein [Sclerotinia sclerotiorum 1980 UF-70]EDN95377.1 predicted protein [Sclerotinia sclerotiorum 1980 UF-70]
MTGVHNVAPQIGQWKRLSVCAIGAVSATFKAESIYIYWTF